MLDRFLNQAVEVDIDAVESDPAQFGELQAAIQSARERFIAVMDDDFNTAAAIAVLFETAGAINRFVEQNNLESTRDADGVKVAFAATRQLIGLGRLLGLFITAPKPADLGDELIEQVLQLHVEIRNACRERKRFELADLIRDRLGDLGIGLEDKSSETRWSINGGSSTDLINALMNLHIEARAQSRLAKDFELADMIRNRLADAGVTLEDKPTGTVWRVNGN